MDKNKNQTLMVKIICVLLSFGLWLYVNNVANPTRTYDVRNIPVELINLDYIQSSNLSLVDGQNFAVNLKIDGSWGDVNKVKASDFKLQADMSSYALKEGENVIPVEIINYPSNITIKNNGVLSVKVNLESITTRQLTVKSQVKVNYKKNIHEVNQIIDPKTIEVTGGKSTLDKISNAVIQGDMSNVGEDTTKSYDVVFLDTSGNAINDIKSNVSTVKLSVLVTSGKSVPINLIMTGTLKEGYELVSHELVNSMVGIVGNADVLNSTTKIDTESLDISSITGDTEVAVNLKIPNGITIQNSEKSVKVKFKVKKKESSEPVSDTETKTEDEVISKNITCSVTYEGLKDTLKMDTSTKEVNVSISGAKTDVDKITKDNLSVIVDLSKIDKEGEYKLNPKASFKNGENLTIVSVDSANIKLSNK